MTKRIDPARDDAGVRLRTLRLRRGMSQVAVADLARISPAFVSIRHRDTMTRHPPLSLPNEVTAGIRLAAMASAPYWARRHAQDALGKWQATGETIETDHEAAMTRLTLVPARRLPSGWSRRKVAIYRDRVASV